MSAPLLLHQLVLESPERVGDGAGGFVQTWVALGTLWVSLEARGGRGVAQTGAAVSRAAYRIVVRGAPMGAPDRPRPGQRFRDGSRLFHIEAVTERDPRARYLVCHAHEEVAI